MPSSEIKYYVKWRKIDTDLLYANNGVNIHY